MASNFNSSPSSPTETDPGFDLSESMVSNEEASQPQRKRKVLTNIEPDIKKLKLNNGMCIYWFQFLYFQNGSIIGPRIPTRVSHPWSTNTLFPPYLPYTLSCVINWN